MLALEAEMNPHFLYNSLSVIQIMADNANIPDIGEVCRELSYILRYVISSDKLGITIESEVNHTSNYLSLMYRRFYDQLSYSITVDPAMAGISTPKMILQPLVENCFKHAFNTKSDWMIEISGYMEGESWYLKVSDNGSGYDEEAVGKFKEALARLKPTDLAANENRQGIGLINIAMRMRLTYGDRAVFTLSGNEWGGLTVILGVRRESGDQQGA